MRTMIAVPCMDMVHTDFLRSCVGLQVSDEIQWTTCQSSLPYDARNKLAEIAVEENFDRVLWLDSDMQFDPYLFRRLSEHLDLGMDMITGLYFGRKNPIRPIIYKDLRADPGPDGIPVPVAENYDDYERDSLFEVAGCGFGGVMTTVELLRDVREKFRLPFYPTGGLGEDFSFCLRARQLGYRIWCDSSIKLGHVGTAVYDEAVFRSAAKSEGGEP